jgi:predicted RNA-binding Zn ribbon-like protein
MPDVADREWALPSQPLALGFAATMTRRNRVTTDKLQRPEDFTDWLNAVGLPSVSHPLGTQDVEDVRRLRSAIRRALAHVTEDRREPVEPEMPLDEALAEVNKAASRASRRQLDVSAGKVQLRTEPETPTLATSLADVAQDAIALIGGEESSLLRACYAPNCPYYFVASNPGREWCSIACGNRVRAARHYDKTRTQPLST